MTEDIGKTALHGYRWKVMRYIAHWGALYVLSHLVHLAICSGGDISIFESNLDFSLRIFLTPIVSHLVKVILGKNYKL